MREAKRRRNNAGINALLLAAALMIVIFEIGIAIEKWRDQINNVTVIAKQPVKSWVRIDE